MAVAFYNKKIVIADRQAKTSKTGKEYYFIKDDQNNVYSFWINKDSDREYIEGLPFAKEIEVRIKDDGQYKNILSPQITAKGLEQRLTALEERVMALETFRKQ